MTQEELKCTVALVSTLRKVWTDYHFFKAMSEEPDFNEDEEFEKVFHHADAIFKTAQEALSEGTYEQPMLLKMIGEVLS